ncbi:MAG TPA: hypothetical protein VGO09_03710 [Flavisolibacter sp.]|jgi:hypothetical protein|nr:hypothetical protein [Flavisolibacter sp.]
MKYKTRLEIKLPETVDPFNTISKLLVGAKIIKAQIVNVDTIVVLYDNRKISQEIILKLTEGRIYIN